jgi:hypothetical protein
MAPQLGGNREARCRGCGWAGRRRGPDATLINAAQVKLGRRDARLLIDVSTVAHEHARPYLPNELTKQIDQALGQLRLSQVTAEGHPGPQGEPEQNDLDRVPTPPG